MNQSPIIRPLVLCVVVAMFSIFSGDLSAASNPSSLVDQFKLRYGFDPTIATSSQSPAQSSPDDIYWDNSISPSLQGVDGTINCAVVYNGSLVVAGQFTVAGSVMANNIAIWNGTSWSALGSGFDQPVKVLAVYGSKLVASGDFAWSGNTSVSHIATWNGTTWSPMGPGLEQSALALAEYNGKLYVGGVFVNIGAVSARGIASWNGTSWSAVGSGMATLWGSDTQVRALTVFDNKLIAGGIFTSAGGVSANYVAAWNGTSWSAFGSGLSNVVYALTVYDSTLVAAGPFDTADGAWAYNISRWDGQKWSIIGDGLNTYPTTLASYNGSLIAGGNDLGVQMWNGSTWTSLGGAELYGISVLTVYKDQLVGGLNSLFSELIKWNGSSWVPLGSGVSGTYPHIFCYTLFNDKLIAGGYFGSIGGVNATNIAEWDGTSWTPIGTGLNNSVYSLTVYDNKLIAGGQFTVAGGVVANHVAAWDGNLWSPVGSGFIDSSTSIPVAFALQVYGDNLIVGGSANQYPFDSVNVIASWNGSSWTSLGAVTQLEDYGYSQIDAFAIYGNKLIAGGVFVTVGGVSARGIAAWDGSSWSPLKGDGPGSALSMAIYNGQLVVGHFSGVSEWDGSTWQSMGTMVNDGWVPQAFSLCKFQDHLMVGGSFDSVNGISANGICSWNGLSWSPLGSGVRGSYAAVYALAEYHNTLVAGGSFSVAGNKVAGLTATWLKSPTDVNDGGHDGLPQSFALEQNYPNPFNPSTQIQFTLPTRSHVSIDVYNMLGQSVRRLVDETRSAGTYTTTWDGKDNTGNPLATGVYFYKLQTGDFRATRKMILLK